MASKSQIKASMKYDKTHTARVAIKLNLVRDKDILDKLSSVPNKQGYIKQLIRNDIDPARTCLSVPENEQ